MDDIVNTVAAESQWFTVVGLAFDMAGVVVIAIGVVASKKQLVEQGKQSGAAY